MTIRGITSREFGNKESTVTRLVRHDLLRSNVRKFLTFVLAGLVTMSVVASFTLPSPAQGEVDFAHPDQPHPKFPLFSPDGGLTSPRALLVIFVRFDDVSTPPQTNLAWIRDRVFGENFPSVVDYFNATSFGKFQIVPAEETEGTHNDGVVTIDFATFDGYRDDGRPAGLDVARWEARQAMRAADQFIDFSAFDTDGDGTVGSKELKVLIVREANPRTTQGDPPQFDPDWWAAARAPFDLGELDGIEFSGRVAMAITATNLISKAHEVAHVLLSMRDLYGFGVGSLSIAGPTVGMTDSFLVNPSGYEKLHWGWIDPIVVEKDGWFEIEPAHKSGQAYILYDPDRGKDDYFLVENRLSEASTYDQGVTAGGGLVIWRIDDPLFDDLGTAQRPIEIMRIDGTRTPGCNGACYGGDPRDVWDAAVSPDRRTMIRPWRDGSANDIAVRAIGAAGGVMNAYLDVPGPGVLLDTFEANQSMWLGLPPGGKAIVDLPITNTDNRGAQLDNFIISSEPNDVGILANGEINDLSPRIANTVPVEFIAAADAPQGVHEIWLRASSRTRPSVTSSSKLIVIVGERQPDSLEENGTVATASSLEFDDHVHINPAVLEDRSFLRSSSEIWTGRIENLNLHNNSDTDFFKISIPNPADPGDDGHSVFNGVPECGVVERLAPIQLGGEQFQDVAINSVLTVEIEGAINDDALRAQTVTAAGAGTGRLVINCPRTQVGGNDVIVSVGERLQNQMPRGVFPAYNLRFEYKISVTRMPPGATWARAILDAEGLGSVAALGCGGGVFPICTGPELFNRLRLTHPFAPERDCSADGCPDHFLFEWPTRSNFSLQFATNEPGLTFEILDKDQFVLAEAFSPEPNGDPIPIPIPIDRMSTDVAGEPSANIVVPPNVVTEPPSRDSSLHLFVYDLKPGIYALRITGPSADYQVAFSSPPSDADGDEIWDRFDLCAGSATGHPIDEDGCTGTQIVGRQCPADQFRNHGMLVSCVAQSSKALVSAGLLTKKQRKDLITQAARFRH